MEWIDLETWPRREQYRYFRSLDRPQYDLCARLDVTRFCAFMKARGGPPTTRWGISSSAPQTGSPPSGCASGRGGRCCTSGQPLLHRAARGRRALQVRRGRVVRGPRRVPAPLRRGVGAGRGTASCSTRRRRGTTTSTSPACRGSTSRRFRRRAASTATTPVPHITWGKYAREGGRVTMPLSVTAHTPSATASMWGGFSTRSSGCWTAL